MSSTVRINRADGAKFIIEIEVVVVVDNGCENFIDSVSRFSNYVILLARGQNGNLNSGGPLSVNKANAKSLHLLGKIHLLLITIISIHVNLNLGCVTAVNVVSVVTVLAKASNLVQNLAAVNIQLLIHGNSVNQQDGYHLLLGEKRNKIFIAKCVIHVAFNCFLLLLVDAGRDPHTKNWNSAIGHALLHLALAQPTVDKVVGLNQMVTTQLRC